MRDLPTFQSLTGQEPHGFNVQSGFENAANGDYHLNADSALIDRGLLIPGINDDYTGAAPDIGVYEFTPSLTLRASPADRAIHLSWTVNTTLPLTSTWKISYTGPPGNQPSPVTGIISPTRAYTLTGLSNYHRYTVTLNAMLNSAPFLTDTATATPTDIFVYLPLLLKN